MSSKKILTNNLILKKREGSPSSISQISESTRILEYFGQKHSPVTINIVESKTENITINQNTNNIINSVDSASNNSNVNKSKNEQNILHQGETYTDDSLNKSCNYYNLYNS